MNRLWVRFSLVIVTVMVLVNVYPIASRLLSERMGLSRAAPFSAALPPVGAATIVSGTVPSTIVIEGSPPPDTATFFIEGVPAERVARFQRQIEDWIWDAITRNLLFSSVVALAVGVLLSRSLAKPLGRLEAGAKALAAHRLNYRVPVSGSREMASVARSFNQMAAELEQAEALRRNMLADVAHELRHPVHVIQGSLQAILDGVYPFSMEEIARLSDQTQHLTRLVNDLHELAQAEARQLPLWKQPADVVALVAAATESFQPLAGTKDIALQVSLPPHPIALNVDAERIRQVLQNLLGNALRFTPAGGEIAVAVEQDAEDTLIRVRDTGIGMTPDELPRVFDRFYRADASRSRDHGGAGLGLAIAQAVVRAHGGDITASSEGKGRGSLFVVRLRPDAAQASSVAA